MLQKYLSTKKIDVNAEMPHQDVELKDGINEIGRGDDTGITEKVCVFTSVVENGKKKLICFFIHNRLVQENNFNLLLVKKIKVLLCLEKVMKEMYVVRWILILQFSRNQCC
jgi:hypothetical protein